MDKMFLTDTPTVDTQKACSYFMFKYKQGLDIYPHLLTQINTLSYNVGDVISSAEYCDKHIVVAFQNRRCNGCTLGRKVIGFLICITPTDGEEKSTEIVKMYGEVAIRQSMIDYFLTQKTINRVFIYSSTLSILKKFITNGYHTPKISSTTINGLIFFRPKIRLSGGGEVPKTLGGNSIDFIYKLLEEYIDFPMYKFRLVIPRTTLVQLKNEVDTPEYNISGAEIETAGRLKIKDDSGILSLHVVKTKEFKGTSNSVNVTPCSIGYHIHPINHVVLDQHHRYLMAWPSGGDYCTDFLTRFYYKGVGRYVSFVVSKYALYSMNITPMALYIMKTFIITHTDSRVLMTMIAMATKYYFKLVEDLRTVHKHSYGKHTKHVLPSLRKSTGNLHKWLCSSFTCDKIVELLDTDMEELRDFFVEQCGRHLKEDIDTRQFDKGVIALRRLMGNFNCPIFNTDYVLWGDINWGIENPMYIELSLTQGEYTDSLNSGFLPSQFNYDSAYFKSSKVL
jgi:hypothetical protein